MPFSPSEPHLSAELHKVATNASSLETKRKADEDPCVAARYLRLFAGTEVACFGAEAPAISESKVHSAAVIAGFGLVGFPGGHNLLAALNADALTCHRESKTSPKVDTQARGQVELVSKARSHKHHSHNPSISSQRAKILSGCKQNSLRFFWLSAERSEAALGNLWRFVKLALS